MVIIESRLAARSGRGARGGCRSPPAAADDPTSGGNDSGSQSGAKGGTLYYLTEHPRRAPRPAADLHRPRHPNLNRTVYRSLVSFPTPRTADEAATRRCPTSPPTPAPPTRTARPWKFTLKDGVKWEDGKDITCEDFKYGVSRVVRHRRHHRWPELHAVATSTSRRTPDGLAVVQRPVQGRRPGRLRQGGHLRRQDHHLPVQQAVAGLPAGDRGAADARPVPRGQGPGRRSRTTRSSPTAPTSSRASGTRTRAAPWSATTSTTRPPTTDIRKALPDKIVFSRGLTNEVDQRPADRRLRRRPVRRSPTA